MKLTILQWNIWYKQNIRHVAEVLQTKYSDHLPISAAVEVR